MKTGKLHSLFLIAFALLLLLGGSGFYLVASLQTIAHRANYEFSSAEQLVQLELSREEFKNLTWIGEKDFIFHGSIFDAENIKVAGDKIIVTCEQDTKEESLFRSVKDQSDADAGSKTKQKTEISFLYDIPSEACRVSSNERPFHYAGQASGDILPPHSCMNIPPPKA